MMTDRDEPQSESIARRTDEDDTEGHKRFKQLTDEDDTEGHKRFKQLTDEDDTEGHTTNQRT